MPRYAVKQRICVFVYINVLQGKFPEGRFFMFDKGFIGTEAGIKE